VILTKIKNKAQHTSRVHVPAVNMMDNSSNSNSNPKMLLVMDINGTIAHYTWKRPSGVAASRVGDKWLVPRPHLDSFLDALERRGWAFAVWTCSQRKRAVPAAEHLLQGRNIEFVFGQEDCVRNGRIKDLRQVWNNPELRDRGWNQHNTIVIDDSPSKLSYQPKNLVVVSSFDSNMLTSDRGLIDTLEYLIELSS
jgi:hypothetical protein